MTDTPDAVTDPIVNELTDAPLPEPTATAATAAPEPPEAASEADPPDDETADKQMARLAHDARDARRRTRALEREIAVLRGQRQEAPDVEMDRRVDARAAEIAATQQFNSRCNAIYAQGVKTFGRAEFDEVVKELNDVLGGMSPALIEAAEDAGNAAQILQYLGQHSDVAERVATLPPHRMGVELGRIAAKLERPKPTVSKAPPPIKPLNGSGGTAETDPDKMSMAEYMQHENQRLRGLYK